jgi:ABC-type phosphate transport system substrate-binding protein
MNHPHWNRWSMGTAALLVAGAVIGMVGGVPTPAGASTDPGTLSGEGGTFLQPVVTKLIDDASSNLDGLFGAYVATGLEGGIKDFIGTAPKQFNADFDVSERPLTPAEVSRAKANGRSFTYVPFAATPVAIGTMVATGPESGTIGAAALCPHIDLSVADLGAVFGLDSAQPVSNWADPRFKCSNGAPLNVDGIQLAANADPTMANYALMSLLDSDPVAKGYFAAGLRSAFQNHGATTSSTTPTETWPYTGQYVNPGGDDPFLGKLMAINATTNAPSDNAGAWALGAAFPVSSVWTGTPLGAPWNIPTVAVQNANGSYVAPSTTSAAAAEHDATLAKTSNPTANNLVVFKPDTGDAAAYNNYLMEESYLVVPTNGLPADKATALADFIRFVLGPDGQRDIKSFGAAPATTAMDTAGLDVADQLDAEAAKSAAAIIKGGTTTTSTTVSKSTAASGTSAGGSGSATGGSATTDGGTDSNNPDLAFTGAPDLGPITGLGALLLVVGAYTRRRLRRRTAKS